MAKHLLLVLAAAAALQKPPTPPRPQHRKAVEDPALNSLSNEPLTHSVLAHDDGAEHLGDVGGAHLDTDLSFFAKSRIAFSPAQRVALTANGNLQRVLSAYHNERVTIRVLSHERESLGLWRRRVVLELADRPACVARSSVVARTRTAIEEASKGGGLGQLFGIGRQAGVLAPGSRKGRGNVARVYVLSNAHLVCHIEEVMPLNPSRTRSWRGRRGTQGAFLDGERGGFASEPRSGGFVRRQMFVYLFSPRACSPTARTERRTLRGYKQHKKESGEGGACRAGSARRPACDSRDDPLRAVTRPSWANGVPS